MGTKEKLYEECLNKLWNGMNDEEKEKFEEHFCWLTNMLDGITLRKIIRLKNELNR